MLQAQLIGNLGATAEVKSVDGRKFITFRVADSRSYTDAAGNKVSQTDWIDCTMNYGDSEPAILKYLVSGQTVYVQGPISKRVYSSMKDRCMKAGITIHVREIELIGGTPDAIPKVLYTQDGVQVDITKWYYAGGLKNQILLSRSGGLFQADANGWVTKQADGTGTQSDDAQQSVQSNEGDAQQAVQGNEGDVQQAVQTDDAPFTGTDTQEQQAMSKTSKRRSNASK